jgi:hypothetical protein
MLVGAEAQFKVGQPDAGHDNILMGSAASRGEVEVMFEDDGETGYFYVIRSKPEMQIVDALHIYNVSDVADRHLPVTGQIVWDEAEHAAAFVINGYCHALYDFQQQAGFCRNAFPPPLQEQAAPRELTDELVDRYFAA